MPHLGISTALGAGATLLGPWKVWRFNVGFFVLPYSANSDFWRRIGEPNDGVLALNWGARALPCLFHHTRFHIFPRALGACATTTVCLSNTDIGADLADLIAQGTYCEIPSSMGDQRFTVIWFKCSALAWAFDNRASIGSLYGDSRSDMPGSNGPLSGLLLA